MTRTNIRPRQPTAWDAGPTGLPRLLRDLRDDGPVPLDEHVAARGPLPLERAGVLVDTVEAAGLRGRGGAGFPTARKLRAVAAGRRRPVVVANGTEGEPASAKDQLLLARAPHLVIDGIVLAAAALGASEAIVAVDRTRVRALVATTHALEERAATRHDPVPIRVVAVPGRYVAGEESALVHFLNGGDAKPTLVPPRPFERGVAGRPTLIQNAETLAHLSLIARYGPEWFREVGTHDEPGTALITLGGAVARPGVCEIALGTSFDALVDACGGTTRPISAYLVGGYFGTWIRADHAGTGALSTAQLGALGGSLGCGAVVALPADRCGVFETARVLQYLAEETAGQCGPCVNGLASIAATMDRVARTQATRPMLDDLRRWADVIAGRGACRLPDGAIRLLRSTLQVFAKELDLHRHGQCSATSREPVLPIPGDGARDWGWR